MTSTAVQWRRVTVVDGADRREILVSTQSPLSDSLRNEGIDVVERSVVVIASDGSRIDVSQVSTVAEGALLTVVEPRAPGRSKPLPRRRVATGPYDFTATMWVVAGSATLIVALVAALSPTPGDEGAAVLRYTASIVFAALSLVSVFATSRTTAGFTSIALFVPAMLGFSAGFLAVPPELAASVHLALFAGLATAALAQAGVHVRATGTIASGATSLVTVTIAVLAALFAAVLVLGFDASVAAALAAGAAPVALRVLPSVCLDIPEGQLLEYGEFMRNRWTVRGAIPEGSHPVTAVDMRPTMTRARVQFRAGTVFFSLIPPLVLPLLLVAPGTGVVSDVATVVLVSTIILSFMLSPRRANTPLLRWAPRVGAALVALEFTVIAGIADPGVLGLVLAGSVLVVALVVAATMVPIARGTRSLGISRTADIFENLATAFSFPAAFVAATMIDILRGAVS